MQWYGVHPSVYHTCPLQQRAVGLLLWARQVGDIDQLLHGQHHSSMEPQHGVQQQMWAVSCSQLMQEAQQRLC